MINLFNSLKRESAESSNIIKEHLRNREFIGVKERIFELG